MLLLYSILHLLVDAVCASTLFTSIAGSVPIDQFFTLIIVYNTLAFCTQWMTGLCCDRFSCDYLWLASALGVLLLGVCLGMVPACAFGSVFLLGMGNSVFHVAAGRSVIRASGGVAAPLGIFVGPGAVGVALGSFFPIETRWPACILLALGLVLVLWKRYNPRGGVVFRPLNKLLWLVVAVVLVLVCVMARSASGGCIEYLWKETALDALILGGFVAGGKMCGGWLADRFGVIPVSVCSMLMALGLMLSSAGSMPLSLIGQFCANLLMPVTLYLLVRAYPQSPGLMFGLAASVLLPGTLFQYTGSVLMFTLLYVLGLVAVVTAALMLKERPHGIILS